MLKLKKLLLCSMLFALWGSGQAFAFDLQQEIREADAGDVVVIPAGEHAGPILLDQPIVLHAEPGVVLVSDSDESTLVIQTDGAEVRGLTIHHRFEQLDIPAISVTGDHNTLAELTIDTGGMGIALLDANDNELIDVTITGAVEEQKSSSNMSAREGNGIDLFRSNDNKIVRTRISGVQDGVYIERGSGNIVSENVVTDSRYGYHLMFTEETRLEHNESFGNITGAMVMGTRGTSVQHNHFYKQSAHVFSQGLMLYDVQDATITDNVIEENLVGLYIDSSFDNELSGNTIRNNYIGVDMNRSERNSLQSNQLTGNMIPARAARSTENEIHHNYWEAHRGFDLTGDRVSEMPFYADLIFPAIVDSKSIYQIFADSPGMLFLQLILDVDQRAAFVDTAPLMDWEVRDEASTHSKSIVDVVVYSAALFLSMLVMFIMGGKVKWVKRNV